LLAQVLLHFSLLLTIAIKIIEGWYDTSKVDTIKKENNQYDYEYLL
jgi:hypothetical protein